MPFPVFHLSSFLSLSLPLSPSPLSALSISLPLSLPISIPSHGRGMASGTLIHVPLFVCFVGGSVQTVDARREVIISLSHLIISANYSPEYIFAPACLNECTWLQAGVGVLYSPLALAVCAPSFLLLLSLSLFLVITYSPPVSPPRHDLRIVKTALNRSTICLAAWSN